MLNYFKPYHALTNQTISIQIIPYHRTYHTNAVLMEVSLVWPFTKAEYQKHLVVMMLFLLWLNINEGKMLQKTILWCVTRFSGALKLKESGQSNKLIAFFFLNAHPEQTLWQELWKKLLFQWVYQWNAAIKNLWLTVPAGRLLASPN